MRSASATPPAGLGGRRPVQDADDGLAVVAGGGTDLGEDLVLGRTRRGAVARGDRAEIFPLRRGAHPDSSRGYGGSLGGNILRDAIRDVS